MIPLIFAQFKDLCILTVSTLKAVFGRLLGKKIPCLTGHRAGLAFRLVRGACEALAESCWRGIFLQPCWYVTGSGPITVADGIRGVVQMSLLFFFSGMSSSGKSQRIILRRLLSCRSVTVIYTINSVKHKIAGFKLPVISGLLHSIVFTIAEPAPIFSNTNRRWRQKFSLSRPRVLCLGPSCASGSSVIALCSYRGLWQMWCWPLPWES